MKNLIIIILVAISSTAFAKPKKSAVESELEKKQVSEPSKLRKDFETSTGIVLGEYATDTADGSCQDGKLGIVDYGDELGLILGARSLIIGIGKDKLEEKYSDCKLTIKSSYKSNVVEEISEEDCQSGKTVTKTILTIEKDRLSYLKIINSNNAPTEEFKCNANLQKPISIKDVKK